MKSRNTGFLAMAAAALFLTVQPANAQDIPESADPIKLPINEWTGQHITAHIAGDLLQKLGYSVEYVTAGTVPQYTALSQGELHFQPEVWTNNLGDIYPKAVEAGDLVVLGDLGITPRESWIYPPYMEEKCPGLPNYEALYDCAQAFADASTFPKGRLITYPADWGQRSRDLVEMIDLPFEPVPGGSEGAMIAELKAALANKAPILMMFWEPHWFFAEEKMNWVTWDGAPTDCTFEGQTRGNACGFEATRVEKTVSSIVPDKWPAAYRFMKAFTIDNDIQSALMFEVDQQKRPLETVVGEWIENNEAVWGPWIAAAKGD